MSKSNSPQALSLVSIVDPNNFLTTLKRMVELDEREFGFSHRSTWNSLSYALRGKISASSLERYYKGRPTENSGEKRVRLCKIALVALGEILKLETTRFADVRGDSVRPNEVLDWGPDLRVTVLANCWYVSNGVPIIPILQPRKKSLTDEQLAVYAYIARLAYCKGDWVNARIQIIDLSGVGDEVVARLVDMENLPEVSEALVLRYVQMYQSAQMSKPEKKKKAKKPKMLPIFEFAGVDV